MSLIVLLRVCVRKREKGCVIVNQKVDVHGVVKCCCGGTNKKNCARGSAVKKQSESTPDDL